MQELCSFHLGSPNTPGLCVESFTGVLGDKKFSVFSGTNYPVRNKLDGSHKKIFEDCKRRKVLELKYNQGALEVEAKERHHELRANVGCIETLL